MRKIELTKEEHEELVTDYEAFNDFLNKYTEHIMQNVLLAIPEMVIGHIREVKTVEKLKDIMYKKNPELVGHTELMQRIAVKVQNDNADWGTEQVFTETAKQAVELLKIEGVIDEDLR